MMNIVCISGSPRKKSNTDHLLRLVLDRTGGEFIKLSEYHIEACSSCWACVKSGQCVIADDMTATIVPKILAANVMVIGSPVYFNNVTAQMKAFMDRTWAIGTKLRDKIGAAVVAGRKYGAEGAITAIHAFFLKHDMIVAHRGISATAFGPDEVGQDAESLKEIRAAAEAAPSAIGFGWRLRSSWAWLFSANSRVRGLRPVLEVFVRFHRLRRKATPPMRRRSDSIGVCAVEGIAKGSEMETHGYEW